MPDRALPPLVELSGALVIPLIFIAAAATVLVVVQGRRLWLATRHSEELLQRVALLGREGRRDEAEHVARDTPGVAARVVRAGLEAAATRTGVRIDDDAVATAMQRAIRSERRRLGRGARLLDWLGALATLVPAAALAVDDDTAAALAALALGLGVTIAVALARWTLVAARRRAALEMERAASVLLGIPRDDAASR